MVRVLKRKTDMKKTIFATSLLAVMVLFVMGFRSANTSPKVAPQGKKEAVDNGIGPIKSVKLGKIDQDLVDQGNSIFYSKCYLCHDIDQQKLAPPLRGVAKEQTPEFIMNYLLNTAEMQEKDPKIKALMEQFSNVPKMPDQQLTKDDARAVLEFLRTIE
jgi:mono/diheme cytochrome c family protein